MQFKSGISIKGVRPELLLGLIVVDGVYTKLGEELVITALSDGKHKSGSFHYLGLAADLRTRFFKDNGVEAARLLKIALGNEFDVILEKDHIHIEYQPKT